MAFGKVRCREERTLILGMGSSAIGMAAIFWSNNRKELRRFLHDSGFCLKNNRVERSVSVGAVYRNTAFVKKSIKGAKGI